MTRLVFAAFGSLRLKGGIEQAFDRLAKADPPQSILATLAYPFEIENCIKYAQRCPKNHISLWLDSGAFTAWKKGQELQVDEYLSAIDKLRKPLSCFKEVFCVGLDKIPGKYQCKPTAEDLRVAEEVTLRNTERCIAEGINILPVHHQGDSLQLLKFYLENFSYIGISPANDSPQLTRLNYIKSVGKLFLNKAPDGSTKVIAAHNFGNISTEQLKLFPFYSADSTSWKLAVGFGGMHSKSVLKGSTTQNKSPMNSYRARHLPVGIYVESIRKQMQFEQELKSLWKNRKVSWVEPKGIEL